MKKRVLLLIMCVFALTTANAQVISIVGDATPGGWPDSDPLTPDTNIMKTTDNITYTFTGLVVTSASAKFRQDGDWTKNWGSGSFPSGIGTQGGANIPVIAGTYDVTFNITTGAYTFAGGAVISVVKILGTAVTPPEGLNMSTKDGAVYKTTTTFLAGEAKFDVDGVSVSNMSFPAGLAAENGPAIMVPAGTFTVTLDITTGAYSFAFPVISLTGSAAGGWGFDNDLTTTDGINYSINGLILTDGAAKFRQEHDWTVGWSDIAFPIGVGTGTGSDIPVVAGTYNVTLNISTGEYVFTNVLSTKGFSSLNFKVSPNPTQGNWSFTSTNERIESIQIVDVLGKNVMNVSPKSNTVDVDASNLTRGMYFAKIATAKATETIKLMKN